jgi:hypothetical protein
LDELDDTGNVAFKGCAGLPLFAVADGLSITGSLVSVGGCFHRGLAAGGA